jgi:hypothetical protein
MQAYVCRSFGPILVILILGPATITPGNLHADEKPLVTFVLAGQSNMVGKRCAKKELPDKLQKPNRQVLFFAAAMQSWIPIQPGKTEPQGFGPEISFGARMAERLKRPIGIIKHSRGGTNLAHQWNPDTPGSLYAELLARVKAARSTRKIHIAGMAWQQGGADSKREEMAVAYAQNLTKLIQRAREDFQNPKMAFVCGRIPPKDNKRKPFWKPVRNAQQNLSLFHYAWIDCDAISVGPDKIHYDAKGMVTLGNLQADKMLELIVTSNGSAAPRRPEPVVAPVLRNRS